MSTLTAPFATTATLAPLPPEEQDLHARAWRAARRRAPQRGPARVLASSSVKVAPVVLEAAKRAAHGDLRRVLLTHDGGALVIGDPSQKPRWRDYARRV